MISICMITKNEEAWISGALQHLKPLGAEIIIADTGSTDRTCEIAAGFGAKIVHTKWEEDFSKARNLSLSLATQPWILVVDPDERISTNDVLKLKELVITKSYVKAFAFQTRNYVRKPTNDGKSCEGQFTEEKDYPFYFLSSKIRLFKNHLGIHFKGVVHETVSESVISVCKPGEFEESDIFIHHYGTDPEIVAQKKKRELYRKLTEKKVQDEPMNPEAHLEYGKECLGAGDGRNAYRSFRRAVELEPSSPYYLAEFIAACEKLGMRT